MRYNTLEYRIDNAASYLEEQLLEMLKLAAASGCQGVSAHDRKIERVRLLQQARRYARSVNRLANLRART